MKRTKLNDILQPLQTTPIQAYFGKGLHTLGLLTWLLPQTGAADVWVSSYSTSEPFLNGFYLARKKGMVRNSAILLDQRAARKTLKLERLMVNAFDKVFLGQNHSKILLVRSDTMVVSVITSQNQTYGDRAESTIVTTDKKVFEVLLQQFIELCGTGAAEIDLENGRGIITESTRISRETADAITDWRPFDVEL